MFVALKPLLGVCYKVIVLLYGDEIVVLLATLNEQVLAVDKVVGSNHAVEGSELLLVERHAATLNELAHLPFEPNILTSSRVKMLQPAVRAGPCRV